MGDAVTVEYGDGVIEITINRPDARNALNGAVRDGITAALAELDDRDDLAIAILTGAGGTFSAGMDLKAFLAGELSGEPGRGMAGLTPVQPRKPVIAAIEGYALAGGCELALACDLRVAAENATFGIPEVKRGLVAGGGGLLRLPRLIPPAIAMELALTGDFFSAADAHRYGLVNTLTIADCVAAAVGQIEQAGLEDVVLVGHSMAGLTVPGVATRLGADRVRRIICVACSVPPQGKRIL